MAAAAPAAPCHSCSAPCGPGWVGCHHRHRHQDLSRPTVPSASHSARAGGQVRSQGHQAELPALANTTLDTKDI